MSDKAYSKHPLQELNRETQKTQNWRELSGKVAALSNLCSKIKEVLESKMGYGAVGWL